MTLGLVCDTCDALSPINAVACIACGAPLGVSSRAPARTCSSCGSEILAEQRFCGSCGTPVQKSPGAPAPRVGGKTSYFSAMQVRLPKLILIKGDGMDGLSYVLSSTEHIVGRREGEILLSDDALLSPRHANFIVKDGTLTVRDLSSANGIFVRIDKPRMLDPGGLFLVGEQLMRIDNSVVDSAPIPDTAGTYFYGSPRKPSRLALTQLLAGGQACMIFRARNDSLSLGREGNDVNFPEDPFISGRHALVQVIDIDGATRFQLTDLGSKNGTFVRIREETPLQHGDYVFMGQQLLRVEIT